jgi:hypothetical protein
LGCAAKLQLKFKGDIPFSLQLLGFVDHLYKSLRYTLLSKFIAVKICTEENTINMLRWTPEKLLKNLKQEGDR